MAVVTVDRTGGPVGVLTFPAEWRTMFADRDVPANQLLVQQRVSKDVERSSQETLTVCALRRMQ
ncbi:hypothetical protein [Halorarum salinum]|uniref:Uncharacterized protein n=1 Tax=Halorarum salinum TaxID=2743089 RepID=A0A7D5QBI0_9EURY|nr:hypothetical protein [Halobaculum salinum]QLG62598.1 hypothetical protein HUG12_13045 [Halobaculum salinum]